MYFNDKKVITDIIQSCTYTQLYGNIMLCKIQAQLTKVLSHLEILFFRITLLWKNDYLFYNLNIKKIKKLCIIILKLMMPQSNV